jgi:hypothetical protein
MPVEEDISKKLAKAPDILVALFWAGVFTGAAFFFVVFAKALYTIPQSFDLPWLLIFVAVFLFILMRKRIKIMRADTKPALS